MMWQYAQVKSLNSVTGGEKHKYFQIFGKAKQDIGMDILIFISNLGADNWEMVNFQREHILLTDDMVIEDIYTFKKLL